MLKTAKLLLIIFFLLSLSLTSEQKEISLSEESSAFDTEINLPGKMKTSGVRGTAVDTLLSEGFETSVPPSGWDTLNLSGSQDWFQASSGHSGNSAEIQYGASIDKWLVTDRIDLSSVSACSLSFWQRADDPGYYKYWGVWVSTSSQTDTATFIEVMEVGPTAIASTWEDTFVDLSGYSGEDTVYVAFRYNENEGTNWWIDDVVIYGINSSPNTPTLIRKFDNAIYNAWYSGVSTYRCTLSVTSTDAQEDVIRYEVLWDEDPQFGSPKSWTTVDYPSGDTAIVDARLGYAAEAETLWYWKARAKDPDGTDDWSNWSATRSFTMDMDLGGDPAYWYQVAGPQFENSTFENLKVEGNSVVISNYSGVVDVGFESAFLPSGWDTLTRGVSSNNWVQATDKVYEGSYSAKITYAKNEADAWLVTDTLDLSPFSSCILSFWGRDTFADFYQYHGIWASTTSQTDTSTFSEVSAIAATAEGTWTKSTVDLSTYAGDDTVYVAFRYNEDDGTNWWIDNVYIKGMYTSPPTRGYITSPPIVFSDLQNEDAGRDTWVGAKWTKSSAYDSIGLQIQYLHGGSWDPVPDGALPGNSNYFFEDTLFCDVDDLTGLIPTTTYDTLRLKAKFIAYTSPTIRSDASPALMMWALGQTGGVTAVPLPDDELKFALYLATPNLLGSGTETEIKYQIPTEVEVRIGVFDLLGREVMSLVNGKQSRGTYSVTWQGTNNYNKRLACGIYFLRMEAGEFRDIKKLVLLR